MKKVLIAVVLVQALTGIAWGSDEQRVQHRSWVSLRGEPVSTPPFARIESPGLQDPENSLLTLGFFPDKQCRPRQMMIFAVSDAPTFTPTHGVASIRVDELTLYEGPIVFFKEGRIVCLMFNDSALQKGLFADAMHGNMIRFQIKINGAKDMIYKSYSLSGFTAAAKRAEGICNDIAKQNIHRYFPPQNSQSKQ